MNSILIENIIIQKLGIKKYHFGSVSGFLRFKNFELNYSFLDWSLPFSFEKTISKKSFRILCLNIFW